MQKRKLGRTDLSVPALVLGGNVFGWTSDAAESFRVLDAALAAGLDAIDTADVYSAWVPGHQGGESEAIIGDWMARRGNRHRLTLATKVGMPMASGAKGLSARWINDQVDASLRRLRTDYIDLYFAHQDDPTVPMEETLEAFGRLVAAGKVRVLGASDFSPRRLEQALDLSAAASLPRYEVLQPLYNLMERADYERNYADIVSSRGLGVTSHSALASGFLTGKYRASADLSGRARADDVGKYLNADGLRVLAALDGVAARHGVAVGTVALSWLTAQPGITAPIASASRPEQIDSLVAAVDLVLSDDDLEQLRGASRALEGVQCA